jgi:hypothetical protein
LARGVGPLAHAGHQTRFGAHPVQAIGHDAKAGGCALHHGRADEGGEENRQPGLCTSDSTEATVRLKPTAMSMWRSRYQLSVCMKYHWPGLKPRRVSALPTKQKPVRPTRIELNAVATTSATQRESTHADSALPASSTQPASSQTVRSTYQKFVGTV